MVEYEEALKKAKELKPEIDNGSEYQNGYVFGFTGDDDYMGGNHAPVAIRKSDGKALAMSAFLADGMGDHIRDFTL